MVNGEMESVMDTENSIKGHSSFKENGVMINSLENSKNDTCIAY
jgi:hypothetical protein